MAETNLNTEFIQYLIKILKPKSENDFENQLENIGTEGIKEQWVKFNRSISAPVIDSKIKNSNDPRSEYIHKLQNGGIPAYTGGYSNNIQSSSMSNTPIKSIGISPLRSNTPAPNIQSIVPTNGTSTAGIGQKIGSALSNILSSFGGKSKIGGFMQNGKMGQFLGGNKSFGQSGGMKGGGGAAGGVAAAANIITGVLEAIPTKKNITTKFIA